MKIKKLLKNVTKELLGIVLFNLLRLFNEI